MEIDKDKWITIAHENIARYMDRGGKEQGDIPELLEGAQLLNTIGIALNVHFSDPSNWTEEELQEAEDGLLCFFKGDSRKAIDVVVDKIFEACHKNERNYITVLPIQLYSEGKLYSLSIFRFRARPEKRWKFIDNVARVYPSFEDWKANNVLPTGKVLYPLDGHLQRNSNGFVQTRCKPTPFASNTSKLMKTADIGTGIMGIAGAMGTLFLSGGAALPFVVAGIGSALYSTARSTYHLVDRGKRIRFQNDILKIYLIFKGRMDSRLIPLRTMKTLVFGLESELMSFHLVQWVPLFDCPRWLFKGKILRRVLKFL
jgi:Domain of unknown function (DUF4781)